jgi:hypothetical protein
MEKDAQGREYQKGGCGGFGKGNFSQLFKSIEDYEKSLESSKLLRFRDPKLGTGRRATVVVLCIMEQNKRRCPKWLL